MWQIPCDQTSIGKYSQHHAVLSAMSIAPVVPMSQRREWSSSTLLIQLQHQRMMGRALHHAALTRVEHRSRNAILPELDLLRPFPQGPDHQSRARRHHHGATAFTGACAESGARSRAARTPREERHGEKFGGGPVAAAQTLRNASLCNRPLSPQEPAQSAPHPHPGRARAGNM